MVKNSPQIIFDEKIAQFNCTGVWSVMDVGSLLKKFTASSLPKTQKIKVCGEGISQLDSAGALALIKCVDELKQRDNEVALLGFSETQQQLLELIREKQELLDYQIPAPAKENFLYKLGKESETKLVQVDGLIILIGDLATKIFEAFGNWRRFQWPSIMANINTTGIQALPILALLSFLIGVVLAYQMGLQLTTYGSNSFIAYLSGMAFFVSLRP